jgi:hypothetical protein
LLKRALLLTAATAALIGGPSLADDFSDITTKVTQQLKTSTANDGAPSDIVIETSGSVVVGVAGPAVEIDSPNMVTNNGTISNLDIASAIGVQLDATATGNGPGDGTAGSAVALDNFGTIDVSGKNDNKVAVLVGIANSDSTGIFNGDITMEAGSTVKVSGAGSEAIHIGDNTTFNGNINLSGTIDMTATGDSKVGILLGSVTDTTPAVMNGDITLSSAAVFNVTGDSTIGIHIDPNSVLNGKLDLESSLTMNPADVTSTTGGGVTGILIENNSNAANFNGQAVTGDIIIGATGAVEANGEGARAVSIEGEVGGDFENHGRLSAIGTATPVLNKADPEALSALFISGSIDGGILNDGPASANDTTTTLASITTLGSAPTVFIGPTSDATTDLVIGTAGQFQNGFSLLNRGAIQASAADPDLNATAIDLFGVGSGTTCAACTDLLGGIFNSGNIVASATDDTKQIGTNVVQALYIGNYAHVALLQNLTETTSPALISAELSGDGEGGGTVYGIRIDQYGQLTSLVNSGTIIGSATTTDTTIPSLTAFGILDSSGTLTSIDNSGTIEATVTTLDNDLQVARAVDLSASQQNITFNDHDGGVVIGDVLFGNGADTLTVSGTQDHPSLIQGDIEFGGTRSDIPGDDVLILNDFSTVTGAVTDRAGGRLDVTINAGGILTLNNDSIDQNQRFTANTFTLNEGGTLNLTLSNTYNLAANPTAGGIVTTTGQTTLAQGGNLGLGFGSFIIVPGQQSQFILFDSPSGALQIGDFNSLQTQICNAVPFLFNNTPSCLTTTNQNGRSQLVLALDPKSASDLGLHGYAAKMFPFANAALTNDDQLGSAVISAGLPVNGVPLDTATGNALYQSIYSQFAPNVTGASRALGIALTDQATGPVGARQRELRMYAGQPGDTTIWGQQFGVSLNQKSTPGTLGYTDSGYGLAVGMDTGDPASGRYGGALTLYSGDITDKDPLTSKTDTLWGMLTGYTDWRGKGLFLDTQASVGVGELDGNRHIDVGGIRRTAHGKRPALLGSLGATTGVILTSGSTVITPLVSLDGLAMRENGYTEHGGGDPNSGDGYDLKVASNYYDSLRGSAGLNLRQDIDLGDFYLQPEARAAYRYDLVAGAEKVKAAFASEPTSQFSLTGPDPDRGNIILGGTLAATTGAWSIGLNYDYLRGTHGSVSQVGTLTLLGRI